MKLKTFATIGLISIFLIGCSGDGKNETEEQVQEVENIKELVHDYSVGNLESPRVSITARELLVTNSDNTETIYRLPEDEFFVSIAPYIEETHP
ncbi:hypothetical protein BKP45_08125 [Anaerobacillus alkalidiazotrophicus]|uniref:Uncharacterized protein n=3 Tax=Anaerobacillus alkalidiazotrophicus TaxID=472963 RepID=A0A1S2M844_9BACI|nr:hypothetical protein BKP45_08125 [Anaerobacillus alkalidiazotrophicus]